MKNILLYCLLFLASTLSAQDQYEPNDDLTSATPIEFNTPIFASVHTRSDLDIYSKTIESTGGILQVTVSNVPSGERVAVSILNETGEIIRQSSGSPTVTVRELICESGIYYVRVGRTGIADGSDDEYRLEITNIQNDVYECNDEFTNATPIEFGATIDGTIFRESDRDIYALQVPEIGVLRVFFTGSLNQFLALTLFDQNQQEVRRIQISSGNSSQLAELICESETYYLQVQRASISSGSDELYSFRPVFENEDVHECNDAPVDATVVNSCLEYFGSMNPSNDEDWYVEEINAAGDYQVRVVDVPAEVEIEIEITDEFNNRLSLCRINNVGVSVACDFTVETPGRYFYRIANGTSNYSTDLYRLSTTVACTNPVEICNNGQDDDGDGLEDCDDGDCATFSSCIDNNCTLTADLESTPAACETNTGSITVTARGGTPPYIYTKDGVNQDNGTFTNLPAGAYTITIQDSEDCEVQRTGILGDDCDDGGSVDMSQLIIGEVVGAAGSQVDIPISIRACERIGSLQGSIRFADPSLLRVDELIDAAISVDGNTDNNIVRFSFFDGGQGNGVPVADDDVLFFIRVTLLGAEGAETTVNFANDPLAVQLSCGTDNELPVIVTPELTAGSVRIVNTYTITGQITTATGASISNVTVNLVAPNRTEEFSTLTDDNGNYTFSDVPAGLDWEVTPIKDLNPQNGINAFGLFLVNRAVILDLPTPQISSPYQYIAADADCNPDTDPTQITDNITALDLLTIQQVLAGTRTEFPCNSASWRFVEATYPIDGLDTPDLFGFDGKVLINDLNNDQQIDFTGVKVGDILGEADPQDLSNQPNIDLRNQKKLSLISTTTATETSNEVWLALTPQFDQQLLSYQIALHLPNSIAQLSTVETDVSVGHAFGMQRGDYIYLNWFSPTGEAVNFSNQKSLVKLKLDLHHPVNDLAALVEISTDPLSIASVAYTGDYEAQPLQLQSVTADASMPFSLQLYPNPVLDELQVKLTATEKQPVVITIFDLLGRLIEQHNFDNISSYNTFSFPTTKLKNGVYYLHCDNGPQQYGERFIVKK